MPTLMAYGGTTVLAGLLVTNNWIGKNILQFVPGYSGRYVEKDPDM